MNARKTSAGRFHPAHGRRPFAGRPLRLGLVSGFGGGVRSRAAMMFRSSAGTCGTGVSVWAASSSSSLSRRLLPNPPVRRQNQYAVPRAAKPERLSVGARSVCAPGTSVARRNTAGSPRPENLDRLTRRSPRSDSPRRASVFPPPTESLRPAEPRSVEPRVEVTATRMGFAKNLATRHHAHRNRGVRIGTAGRQQRTRTAARGAGRHLAARVSDSACGTVRRSLRWPSWGLGVQRDR